MNRPTFFAGAAAALLAGSRRAAADEPIALEVAYAGSMSSIMEGPIKTLAAARFGLTLHGRAQGASGLAQLIASGSISPDVFISVTPSPIATAIAAGKLDLAIPIAKTEMVIAYAPSSPYALKFANAAKGEPWWQLLSTSDLKFGRTDPITDPSGRNTIYVMQLAEALYKEPGLAKKILGDDINPNQIYAEPTIEARLQAGQLDAAGVYKIQPASLNLPFVRLPDEINLSDARLQASYAHASVTLNGKVWHPEPLVYYAAALKHAAHPKEAAAFVTWLAGTEAQNAFRRFSYDSAGNAAPLHA